MNKLFFVLVAVVSFLACAQEAKAQYPGMQREAWYKENVLKTADGQVIVEEPVAEEGEGSMGLMQKASNGRKWQEVLKLYPQVKQEYSRNPLVYGMARTAARNIVGESKNVKDLEVLESIYADYYAVGNRKEDYRYTGTLTSNQWNDMQQMIDYARFSENVPFATRQEKIMEFVAKEGEKTDPLILFYGVLVPLSSEFAGNIAAIRKDNKQSDKYYQQFTEIQNLLEQMDAYVKSNSSSYDTYAMADKIEACEKNRMLVIPFAEYEKLHPMSEIEAHKNDEVYLSKLSDELSRWPNENMAKVVNNYYNNIGASFAKFKNQGDKYARSGANKDAADAYNRAIELAENDVQRYDGYCALAASQRAAKSYAAAYANVNKAIALIPNNLAGYNLKYLILRYSAETIKGSDNFFNTLDRNILAGEMISVLQSGMAKADEEEQAGEFAKAQQNLSDARKYASNCCPENSQLFMHQVSYNTSYSMKSGEIKFTGTLRKY